MHDWRPRRGRSGSLTFRVQAASLGDPAWSPERCRQVKRYSSRDACTTTLDLEGRLLSVERTPTPADLARPATDGPDWTALFTAAGLDIARFSLIEPGAQARDCRQSNRLDRTVLDTNQTPVRIEASSFRGVVSSFAVVFPWKATSPVESSPDQPFYFAFVIGLCLLGLLHLTAGARRYCEVAWRFGLYACAVATVVGLLDPTADRALIIYGPVGAGAMAALAYLAIEPWTRRLWPHVMITWDACWRDAGAIPSVGRDLLVVVACVTLNYAVQRIVVFAAVQFGAAPHAVNHPGHFGILLTALPVSV